LENDNFSLNVLVSYTLDKELNKQELLKFFVENYSGKYKDLISPPEPNQAQGIIIAFGEHPILDITGLFDIFNLKIFTKRIDVFGQFKEKDILNKENIYSMYEILDNIIINMKINATRIGNVIFGNKIINIETLHKLYSYFCKEEELLEFSLRKTKRLEELYNSVLSLDVIEVVKPPESKPEPELRNFNFAIDVNTAPWKSEKIRLNLDIHKERILNFLLENFEEFKNLKVL